MQHCPSEPLFAMLLISTGGATRAASRAGEQAMQTGTRNEVGNVQAERGTRMGGAPKAPSPEKSPGAVRYISRQHSCAENRCVQSPGPVFAPAAEVQAHVAAPALGGQGHFDRFYDPFEPGRVG